MILKPTDAVVVSLFDRTTNMARPWSEAGWLCYCVDIQHPPGETREGNIIKVGADIMRWLPPRSRVKITFAFSPCTNLSVSGARWFREKGLGALCEGLNLFARAVELAEYIGAPYMLENPVSVVSSHYRKPDHSFDPCDYAGYLTGAEEKAAEAYTKKTCLWCSEDFVMPAKRSVPPTLGSKMYKLPPSAERADLRAVTSKGFAKAVFLANRETHVE